MEPQKELKKQAIKLGLCDKYKSEWGTPNVDDLCRKFITGQDFCIQHNWPSVEFIRERFDKQDIERNGIFYEGEKNVVAGKHIIAIGDAVVDVYVPENGICDIYSRHKSKVNLHIGKNAFVYISVLDNSEVTVISKENDAKLKASYFSGTINNKEKFDTIHDKNK